MSQSESKAGQRKSLMWLAFLFGSLTLFLVFLFTRRTKKTSPSIKTEIISILTQGGYSDRMARYWVAVADFETGGFTSGVFKNANNLFGMRVPSQRASKRSGEYVTTSNGTFSKFSSTADSVSDLVLYLNAMRYPNDVNTLRELVIIMKSKGYFIEDESSYYRGVESRL